MSQEDAPRGAIVPGPRVPYEVFRALPKTDLHVHLDGSLRLETILDIAKKERVELPARDVAGLREAIGCGHQFGSLTEYLRGFDITLRVMQTEEALERIAFELAEDAHGENVRYMEVRYAPMLHTRRGLKLTRVVEAVLEGLRRARETYGIKANVIAPAAEVRFGFRPLPSHDIDQLHAAFRSFAAPEGLDAYEETFRGPSLPAGDAASAEERRLAARDLADELGLPVGNAVDFWTEASLFSAAGLTALVFGPGDIAQAHTADEWVSLDQLQRYGGIVRDILSP